MKNKSSLLLFIVFMMTGCSLFYPLNVQNDEFKNTRKISFEVNMIPVEWQVKSEASANITFEKSVSPNQATLTAYVEFERSSSSFPLEKDGFIKASGKNYPFTIQNQETGKRSYYFTRTLSESVKDSTKVKTESKSYSNSNDLYQEKFQIRFTPEMMESAKNTDELIIRFYLGPKQATFRLKGLPMKRLRELLSN